jgi:hypothetical protein
MRGGAWGRVSSANLLLARALCQLGKWLEGVDFCARVGDDKGMKNKTYSVVQTLPAGGIDVLWKFSKKADAVDAVNHVNAALKAKGIPPSVSRCFVK